jgi:hypothetical protein
LTDPPDLSVYDVADEPGPADESTSPEEPNEEPNDNSTLPDEGEAQDG